MPSRNNLGMRSALCRRIAATGRAVIVLRWTWKTSLDNFIVVTTNDLPGYEVTQVLGEVFGLVVRARNVFSNFGASLRTVFGGEVKGYTQLLTDSRNQAIERLKLAAMERGGNAVSRCASIATRSPT